MKSVRILSFLFLSTITISCAHKSNTGANAVSAMPRPDDAALMNTGVAPVTSASLEGTVDKKALAKELAPKATVVKKRQAKRAIQSASKQEFVQQPAPVVETAPAPVTPPAEAAKPEEKTPEEANANVGGFFVNHLNWMLGLGALVISYIFLASRRRNDNSINS